jgi:hypothetical protein
MNAGTYTIYETATRSVQRQHYHSIPRSHEHLFQQRSRTHSFSIFSSMNTILCQSSIPYKHIDKLVLHASLESRRSSTICTT